MSESEPGAAGAGRLGHVRLATWDDDPPVGGQGVYVRGLRDALGAAGVRTSTVAGRGAGAVAYRRWSGHGPLDLSIAFTIAPAPLEAGEPDVVHVSGGPGGIQLLRRIGPPLVYTAHHTFELSHPRYRPQRWYGAVEARAYALAAAVIAVSPSTAGSLRRMGVDGDKVVVVPPGIDLARCAAPASRGERRMLFAGRLEPEKGPLEAVAAMARVVAEVPGATGVVVGRGRLRRAVERKVRATPGLEYRDRVSDEELAACYARADVVLVPSAFEGLGLVALEAMAAGCAVVGYDVAGLHDSVADRGVLVGAGDVPALADAAAALLRDEHRREELGEAAAAHVRRAHGWDRRVREVIAVYHQVLCGR